MYLRKSSESEDRQSASIPAQERELKELVSRRTLTVVGVPRTETMSAKRPGRPVFDGVLRDIADHKADGIICWHLNRLARNPMDGGRIMQGLGDGIIKEIVTPGRSYTNDDDKLMMSIEFGMSTKFVDDLRRVIARGRRESLEAGRWPGGPKLGYRFDRNLRMQVPDPERFEAVKELWQLKLNGWTIPEIIRHAREAFVTRRRGRQGGKPLTPSNVYKLFDDPFYAGVMRWRGETFQGKHQTMISWSEFEEVQHAMRRRPTNTSKAYRHDFAYRGQLTCGACGAMATAGNATNRFGTHYVYYHCCRKSRPYGYCPEPSIEERALEAQLVAWLGRLVLPPTVATWLRNTLPEVVAGLQQNRALSAVDRKTATERKERQLEKLRTLLADDVITREDYLRDRERIEGELRLLREQAVAAERGERLIEPILDGQKLAETAAFRLREASTAEKRALLREVSLNLILTGRNITVQAKFPFSLFVGLREIPSVCARKEYLRTSLEAQLRVNLQPE